MALIECKNLSLGYDGQAVAENINLSVEKGDYLCIIGHNGSGKSTLIKTLLGLAKPLSGEICGDILKKKNAIGYMPQTNERQEDFPATVKEIVMSGILGSKGFFSFYTKNDRKTAKENMEKLGILPLANKKFGNLSGGQRQRVLLARALTATKDILLLDEPCAGLDTDSTGELYRVIDGLRKDGVTIIMVTHDTDAEKYANKILSLGSRPYFGTRDGYASSATEGGAKNA